MIGRRCVRGSVWDQCSGCVFVRVCCVCECVSVRLLKGVIVITWPAAHTDRGADTRRVQRRVGAEGTG